MAIEIDPDRLRRLAHDHGTPAGEIIAKAEARARHIDRIRATIDDLYADDPWFLENLRNTLRGIVDLLES